MKSTAELTLVMRAQNLADGAINDLKGKLEGVATKAKAVAGRFVSAFQTVGSQLSYALGQSAVEVISGGDASKAFTQVGVVMAGALVAEFGSQVVTTLAGSAFVQGIGAALATLGTAMGSFIAAAIPVGMALLPVILVAALIAAVAFLIMNPDIAKKIWDFGASIIKGIIGALAGIGKVILDFLLAEFNFGVKIVGAIVGGLVSLPGKIADVIREAFSQLKIDIGPFHIRASGVTIDLPQLTQGNHDRVRGDEMPSISNHPISGPMGSKLREHAAGGWVGLNGPEIGLLGEKGPEYVVPNHQLGGGMGGAPVKVQVVLDGRVIAEAVDKQLYYSLRRAAPSAS